MLLRFWKAHFIHAFVVFWFSLDIVTSFWQRCSHVIVSLAGSLRGGVMLSRQARLHTACGGLTYNISSPYAPHPRLPPPYPSCLSAVVWPTFIKTNTAICFVVAFPWKWNKQMAEEGGDSWSFLFLFCFAWFVIWDGEVVVRVFLLTG